MFFLIMYIESADPKISFTDKLELKEPRKHEYYVDLRQ